MEYRELNPYEIPDGPYRPEEINPVLRIAEGVASDEPQNYRIAVFITDVMTWIEALMAAQYVLFYQDMREPLLAAYDEVRRRHETLVGILLNGADQDIPVGYDVEGVLRMNGLTGDSLRMKLSGYLTARNRFWRRGGIKYLKLMLKWINTILGSIAAALPPAHALTEVKDAIERVIEDTEEM